MFLLSNFTLFIFILLYFETTYFHYFFPKDSESLKIMEVEVGAKRRLNSTSKSSLDWLNDQWFIKPKFADYYYVFFAVMLHPFLVFFSSILRPLISITFPQGFQIKNIYIYIYIYIWHLTLGSGGKKSSRKTAPDGAEPPKQKQPHNHTRTWQLYDWISLVGPIQWKKTLVLFYILRKELQQGVN